MVLAMPEQASLLSRRCGRRERGTDTKPLVVERSTRARFRGRDGGKASRSTGWRDPSRGLVGTWILVGPSVGSGSPPLLAVAPTTPDVPGPPRKGTLPACAVRSACTGGERLRASRAPAAGTSFARFPDPCRSIAAETRSGQPVGCGALESVSRSGKPGESQEEPAPGPSRADFVRLAASHRSRKGGRREASEKEGRHGARPCEDRESSGSCPYVVIVAEVGRRCLVSKKLVERAPKRAAEASERGPRSTRPTAPNAGGVRRYETAIARPGTLRTARSGLG